MMFNLQLFGGSGASLRPSPSAKARGGKLSLTLDDGSEVELKEDKDLKNASLAYNLTYTNPGLNQTRTPQTPYGDKAYTNNCQRVVVAYELRRRGFRVSAKEYSSNGTDTLHHGYNKMRKVFGQDPWPPGSYGKIFKGAQVIDNLGRTTKATLKNITAQMTKWGAGSRAIVQVSWKGRGSHVFNVENVGGKVRFLDAQMGRSSVDARQDYFPSTKPSRTVLIRTDNVKTSDLDMSLLSKAVRNSKR